jgi:hypothetical protein
MSLIADMLEVSRNLGIVAQLNKLLTLDPCLTKSLVDIRHPVSKAYTEADEFVYMQNTDQDIPTAGLIGVLNGLAINTANFRIAARYDDSNQLTGFCLLELQNGKFVEAT